jgi:type II secretory ATPase GspE/PulE/Tfp pilus assembly ATPase PilB-like protein
MSKSVAAGIIAAAKNGSVIIAGVPSCNIAEGLVYLSRLSQEPIGIGFGGVAIGQVVVRGLCPHCRQSYRPASADVARLKKVFGLDVPGAMERINKLEIEAVEHGVGGDTTISTSKQGIHRLWRPRLHGCKLCDHTGYSGAVGIFEAYQLNDTIAGQLINGRSADTIYRSAVEDGMVSLSQDGLVKALRGLVDLSSILPLVAL